MNWSAFRCLRVRRAPRFAKPAFPKRDPGKEQTAIVCCVLPSASRCVRRRQWANRGHAPGVALSRRHHSFRSIGSADFARQRQCHRALGRARPANPSRGQLRRRLCSTISPEKLRQETRQANGMKSSNGSLDSQGQCCAGAWTLSRDDHASPAREYLHKVLGCAGTDWAECLIEVPS